MPLKSGKSKSVFQHNIRKEVEAGRPVKQAVAIAYAKRREAQKRRKADGRRTY